MRDNVGAKRDDFGAGALGDLARKVDDEGKRAWRRHGEGAAETGRRFGYVMAIVVNAVMYYVFHNLLEWRVPFVTEAWTSVLWAVDLSIAASIVANAVYLGYDGRWLKHVGGIVTGAFSFLSTYVIWRVFPFDFGAQWNEPAQLVLVLVMVGIVIGIVVESVQLVTDQVRG